MSAYEVRVTRTQMPFGAYSSAVIDHTEVCGRFASLEEASDYVRREVELEGDELEGAYSIVPVSQAPVDIYWIDDGRGPQKLSRPIKCF